MYVITGNINVWTHTLICLRKQGTESACGKQIFVYIFLKILNCLSTIFFNEKQISEIRINNPFQDYYLLTLHEGLLFEPL